MTRNQIELTKARETRRANLTNERLTALRDQRNYELGLGNLNELQRSNRTKEGITQGSLDETIRHQMVSEAQQQLTIEDRQRQTDIAQQNVDVLRSRATEEARHNLQSETLSARGQDLNYSASMAATQQRDLASQRQASTSMYGAMLNFTASQNATQQRREQAEMQDARQNQSNNIMRVNNLLNAGLRSQELGETTRAHQASEALTHERTQQEASSRLASDLIRSATQFITKGVNDNGKAKQNIPGQLTLW